MLFSGLLQAAVEEFMGGRGWAVASGSSGSARPLHVPSISLNGHRAGRIEILGRPLIGSSFRIQNRLVYHLHFTSIDKAAQAGLVWGVAKRRCSVCGRKAHWRSTQEKQVFEPHKSPREPQSSHTDPYMTSERPRPCESSCPIQSPCS